MTFFKSLLLGFVCAAASNASAVICYRGTVGPANVAGLKTTATLLFMTPGQDPGRLVIRNDRGYAENTLDVIYGRPVKYVLEGAAGTLTEGSDGSWTTLSARGMLALKLDDEGQPTIYIEPTSREHGVGPQIYRLEMMSTEAECAAAFQRPRR
jgi:hypothetical protein